MKISQRKGNAVLGAWELSTGRCPHSNKLCYPSVKAAKRAAELLNLRRQIFYDCPRCGQSHMKGSPD